MSENIDTKAAHLERKRRNQQAYRLRIKNKGKVELRGIFVNEQDADKLKKQIQLLISE
jgi:hypothetical protein